MPRFLPVTMTALAVLASEALGSSIGGGEMTRRELVVATPSGYSLVDSIVDGQLDSNSFITGGEDMEFGSNIAISDDGTRIAVGAYSNTTNTGTPVEQGGSIFIFDRNGTDWTYVSHLAGSPSEELGSFAFQLLSDGSLLALRRGTIHQVYQIDQSSGALTKVGSDITCTPGAAVGISLVQLSTTTARLASGCSAGFGEVKVLDYSFAEGNWTTGASATLAGAVATDGAAFGFDLSFTNAGDRLAVGAPNYDNGNNTDVGLVRVYDFDGASTFTKIGQDLVGTAVDDKLGFSLDLNGGDGTTLVVGAPSALGATVPPGEVQVYTLNTATPTWDLQDTIVGGEAGQGFGRFIHVSADGSKFLAASKNSYSGDQGQCRVFELFASGTWTEVAVFQGDTGDQLTSAAMTTDGSYIALGSVNASSHGIAQVFESPSLVPSLVTPSPTPSPTSSPLVGNNDLTTFDWDLEYLPNETAIIFSEDAETSEVELHYNISLRNTLIRAFQDDCTTPIPDNVTSLTSSITNTSLTHGDFQIDVDIKQDTITDYEGVWTDNGVGQGEIAICIRLDIGLGSLPDSFTSVAFHEQVFYIDVSLTQGFTINDISLDRIAATNETGEVDFDYEVNACHCDTSGTCVDTILTQGSDVLLCVNTTAENVEIVDIRDLTMTQGTFSTNPIVNGEEDPLTESTINGKAAVIQYQIISAFFEDPNPADIVATGSVLLGFTDDNGRRLLRTIELVHPPRGLEGDPVEPWVVSMQAQGNDVPASSAARGGLIGGLVAAGLAVVGGVLMAAV